MIIDPPKDFAKRTAEILLETKAILIAPEGEPFTLTSGRKSPVYIDGKRLISFPKLRDELMDMVHHCLKSDTVEFDKIGGIESGSIAYAALIADRLKASMIYLRKTPKGFGKGAQVEGILNDDERVILIEDVTSDGGSKIRFANVVREAGGKIDTFFTLFFYNSFDYTAGDLEKADLSLRYLACWKDVLTVLKDQNAYPDQTLDQIKAFLNDPDGWQARHHAA